MGISLALGSAGLFVAPHADAQVTYSTRVLSGDQAPGTEPGFNFGSSITQPTINNSGQVAFGNLLVGTNVSRSIWSEAAGDPGSFRLVARQGDQAPDTEPGINFSILSRFSINDLGQVAFRSFAASDGPDRTSVVGIWSEGLGSEGIPKLVVREGDQAPGTEPGVRFVSFGIPQINNAGQAVFFGSLAGNGVNRDNDSGFWSEVAGDPGSLRLVAREGDQVLGAEPGTHFDFLFSPAVTDAAGRVTIIANVTDGGSLKRSIWSETAADLGRPSLIAQVGGRAPGTGPGVTFIGFNDLTINAVGQAAFIGSLGFGNGVTNDNGTGIWSDGAGSIGSPELVVRAGDRAPGTEPGVNFNFFGPPSINAVGQTAFQGYLTGNSIDGTNERGIWSEAAGSLSSAGLIAREGDQAPDTEPGVSFSSFSDPVINAAGQTVFSATLIGEDIDRTNDFGIWGTGHDGELTLIARTGDPFDVNDDPFIEEFRTIRTLGRTQAFGFDSRFNDLGQLVLHLEFTDFSTGIFVATIPEPAAAGVWVGLLGLGLRRHRRSA